MGGNHILNIEVVPRRSIVREVNQTLNSTLPACFVPRVRSRLLCFQAQSVAVK